MADDNSEFAAQHFSILAEERRKRERQKEAAEAFESKIKDFITDALKNPQNKQNFKRDAYNSAQAAESGGGSKLHQRNESQNAGFMGEEFTGYSEDRPWERDTKDE